ncbi:MAG TPA: hypothetical protein ENN24_05090, partial [Bacteroidetes bacterium]|nr:hypothetical protein [Bacteroidota bacterium]
MKIKLTLLILSILLILNGLAIAQTRTVSGLLTSNLDSKPVSEVTVRIKEGLETVKSNHDGRYSINVPEKSSMVLIFTHPDFDEVEAFIGGRSEINQTLTSSIR